MRYLRENKQDVDELDDLLRYFDATYVSGVTRPLRRRNPARSLILPVRSTPAMFSPSMWNVHDVDGRRTYKQRLRRLEYCNAFSSVIGHRHPSLWILLEAFQMDEAIVATDVISDARGQPPAKRQKRSTHITMSVVCNSYARNAATVARLPAKC